MVALIPYGSLECNMEYVSAAMSSNVPLLIVAAQAGEKINSVAPFLAQLPMTGLGVFGVDFNGAQLLDRWIYQIADAAVNGMNVWGTSNGSPSTSSVTGTTEGQTPKAQGVSNVTYNGVQYEAFSRVGLKFTENQQQKGSLPRLWVWVLAIVASLLVAIFTLSCILNFIQYRQRRDLRTRLSNGEVDLEQLGIIGVSAPPDVIASLPEKTYHSGDSHYEKRSGSELKKVKGKAAFNFKALKKKNGSNHSSESLSDTSGFSQSSCPICLDDYEEGETRVLELPCRHIFHPECIKPFLETRSCLCPLCKQSCLPKGYIPPGISITNVTVRRERMIRLGQVESDRRMSLTLSGMLSAYRRRQERNNPNVMGNHSANQAPSAHSSTTSVHLTGQVNTAAGAEAVLSSAAASNHTPVSPSSSSASIELAPYPASSVVMEEPAAKGGHEVKTKEVEGIEAVEVEGEMESSASEPSDEHVVAALAHEIVQRNVQAIDEQEEANAREEGRGGWWRKFFPVN